MLKWIYTVITLALFAPLVMGQNAQQVLTSLEQKYPSDQCIRVAFTLTYHTPDGKEESLKGKAWRMSDKYRIQMPEQWIVSNGETLWNYLRDIDEIHIEDASEDGEEFNPANFITYYQKAGYIPGLTLDKQTSEGHIQHISFKPEDKEAEIVKARLELVDGSPKAIFAFYRNGIKTEVNINSISPISSPDEKLFRLDPSDYPEAYIEDLRMD